MYKLTIPKPCFQNWNDMIPGKGGRHCSSCSKTVTDFTSMSDEAIEQFFITNQGKNICGRFRSTQIDRIRIDLPANIFSIKIPYWKKFLVAFLVIYGSTFFGIDTTIAGVPFNQADTIPLQDTIPLKDTLPLPDTTQLIDPVTHQPLLQTATTDSLASIDSLIPAEEKILTDTVIRIPEITTTGAAICTINPVTFDDIIFEPITLMGYTGIIRHTEPPGTATLPFLTDPSSIAISDSIAALESAKANSNYQKEKNPQPEPSHDQPLPEFILPATLAVKVNSKKKKA